MQNPQAVKCLAVQMILLESDHFGTDLIRVLQFLVFPTFLPQGNCKGWKSNKRLSEKENNNVMYMYRNCQTNLKLTY